MLHVIVCVVLNVFYVECLARYSFLVTTVPSRFCLSAVLWYVFLLSVDVLRMSFTSSCCMILIDQYCLDKNAFVKT